eukprot:TRINITY_DN29_c2_g4_i1.p1 TRINITY_DN29_c2_g4~~TRINITY_DN29_c2_g4_i1.p1  ORF type:complete len:511 (-),score=225.95 TRINITY_DN29_c2_g4_i1:397-1929(-)
MEVKNIPVKVILNSEVRRFSISIESNFTSFENKIIEVFNLCKDLKIKDYDLTYIDDENDIITIACNQDLNEAIKQALNIPNSLLRITLKNKTNINNNLNENNQIVQLTTPDDFLQIEDSNKSINNNNNINNNLINKSIENNNIIENIEVYNEHNNSFPTLLKEIENEKEESLSLKHNEPFIHENIYCKNCEFPIVGIRYKCCICINYDLCENCESLNSIHDKNHPLLKLRSNIPHHIDISLRMANQVYKTNQNLKTTINNCNEFIHNLKQNSKPHINNAKQFVNQVQLKTEPHIRQFSTNVQNFTQPVFTQVTHEFNDFKTQAKPHFNQFITTVKQTTQPHFESAKQFAIDVKTQAQPQFYQFTTNVQNFTQPHFNYACQKANENYETIRQKIQPLMQQVQQLAQTHIQSLQNQISPLCSTPIHSSQQNNDCNNDCNNDNSKNNINNNNNDCNNLNQNCDDCKTTNSLLDQTATLAILSEIGFKDTDQNIALLMHYNNDIESVIVHYLAN